MRAYIKKELLLVVKPWLYLFSLLSALIVIPSYPVIVGVGYCFLCVYIMFNVSRANRDMEFSAMLPVSRRDIAAGKTVSVAVLELTQLAAAVPFALIADLAVSPGGNLVGLDPNFAFFGAAFVFFSVFNIICIPLFFKSGYRAGVPVLLGVLGALAVYAAVELAVAFLPAWRAALDTLDPAMFPYQLIFLAAGAAVYAASLWLSGRLAARNFEKVSL